MVSARIDEEIDATFDELGDREELAPLIGRRSQAHELVLGGAPSGVQGRSIRTHGDLHLGQVLWHTTVDATGDWMVIDFEGEPARAASARRQKAAPLRDVAGMLRSLSYLAERSAPRRHRGRRRVGARRPAAASSTATGRRRRWRVLPSSVEAQDQQLTMFELEKAFYELRYELDHRPDWVDIPVGSIVGLLDGRDG